jgi:hypothetical protein
MMVARFASNRSTSCSRLSSPLEEDQVYVRGAQRGQFFGPAQNRRIPAECDPTGVPDERKPGGVRLAGSRFPGTKNLGQRVNGVTEAA